jgi:hypothetical protein
MQTAGQITPRLLTIAPLGFLEEPEIDSQRYGKCGKGHYVSNYYYLVAKVYPVNSPERYPGNKLDKREWANISNRLCSPHFHDLRHEPEAGESGRYGTDSIPSYVIHW